MLSVRMRIVEKILEKELIEYYKEKIMDKLAPNKSVRYWDLMFSVKASAEHRDFVEAAFIRLLGEWRIEDRGGGWYRKVVKKE